MQQSIGCFAVFPAMIGFVILGHVSSFTAVAMNSRDQYEIIGLRKIFHFIKQTCKSICLKKAFKFATNAVPQLSKVENRVF